MKTLKIIVVLTLVVAAALLVSSTYAYTVGHMGTSVTSNSASGGTSYGYAGGMMRGYAYSNPVGTSPQPSGAPSNTAPLQPSNQYSIGGYGCRSMMSRIP